MDSTSVFYLKSVQKANVPLRIAHSYSTKTDKVWKALVTGLTHRGIIKYANAFFVCAPAAGTGLFDQKALNQKFSQTTLIQNALPF